QRGARLLGAAARRPAHDAEDAGDRDPHAFHERGAQGQRIPARRSRRSALNRDPEPRSSNRDPRVATWHHLAVAATIDNQLTFEETSAGQPAASGFSGEEFATALLAWFDHHGRKHLPWQQQITPYRVWISE